MINECSVIYLEPSKPKLDHVIKASNGANAGVGTFEKELKRQIGL